MSFEESAQLAVTRQIFEDVPALIAVLKGRELIFEYANARYLSFIHRTVDIFGKPMREVLPELKGQDTFEMLETVLHTGIAFRADETPRHIYDENGRQQTNYFNLIYKPVFDEHKKPIGIFIHAIDISELVIARKAAEQTREELRYAEEKLRTAVEVANLGTWERDLVNGKLKMNKNLMEWRGLREGDMSMETAMENSPDSDRVLKHMYEAMQPDSGGVIDIEYDMVHPDTGATRRLHSQGRVFFDGNKKPLLMTGIAHDMTTQRLSEAETAAKITSKTTELANANEGLRQLNANLEEFVYIASHDLQEPLRKINVFTDMLLKTNTEINEEGRSYLTKIEKSAKRMSLLINNLLEFSQVGIGENKFIPTDLNRLLADIKIDYELLINQKNAVLEIDVLPVIEAIPLQMNQLFYNLVGNSLKFARQDQPSVISISCTMLNAEDIQHRQLNKDLVYCNIAVQDNGIGFDQQYASRIFEIFQRLHGKQEYAGTGIGLSLARKIADNHGGAISASSKENEGAVFNVILPVSRA